MNTSLNSYINEKIKNIFYWCIDFDLISVTTELEEWHYCLLGVEIIFSSGRQLTIDTDYFSGMGLKVMEEPMDYEWNPEYIKKDMSAHPFFSNLINQEITDIQLWWCKNLWTHPGTGKTSGPARYPQELVIETKDGGYLLLSSSEAEEIKPEIYTFCSDEILLTTKRKITKKYELAEYGKGQYQRFKTKG